jgi:hypothetical protein
MTGVLGFRDATPPPGFRAEARVATIASERSSFEKKQRRREAGKQRRRHAVLVGFFSRRGSSFFRERILPEPARPVRERKKKEKEKKKGNLSRVCRDSK